ncbi:glycosyl hydrolase family 28-related protein [Spirosoma agri]|uniref:Rhamnogalacturonase A/B/Epimerase-like pectate lyase domain-containing protein n=1 Tax=Spirosoma agri TaxID=1987381 RepID=A0A6M0IMN3_9BACT|nr:glycosyl hydrolase family 28-related protein [Spirosoma agri]NEU68855.1 hypothetical protein [Spirosoma agri]
MINVKDSQFGAVGNGQTDDTSAIQRAINFAKSLTAPGGGNYRATVFFPAGYYYVSSPIDITNSNGIWLTGDGGQYINTGIIGNTSGAIFDFSGSSLSGCENFFFLSSTGFGNTRSTIGVQFALTANGGLNCGIRQCSFQMEDFATANNGLGTIGVLNIRSEEFFIDACLIRANVSVVLGNSTSVTGPSTTFTATSRFQTLVSGIGSMGVTNIQSTSLENYERRQPALILNGTNSLNFQGYISRVSASNGNNETAIFCTQYTTNMRVHATVESFSRILQVLANSGFEGNDLTIVSANATAPSTELINITGCFVKGLNVRISLPVLEERDNRYVLFHAPSTDPNQQAAGAISNSKIVCYDINSNQYIISANLLKKADNVEFTTSRPFEKRGGRIRQLSNNNVSAGTKSSPQSAPVFRFLQADNLNSSNGRGGYYRIWIDGVVRAGSYGSGGSAVLSFQAQIIVNQNNIGTVDPPSATVIILDKSVTNPAYLDIVGVIVDISFASGVGTVTVNPRVVGNASSESISYDGVTELQSDFLVNGSIPL